MFKVYIKHPQSQQPNKRKRRYNGNESDAIVFGSDEFHVKPLPQARFRHRPGHYMKNVITPTQLGCLSSLIDYSHRYAYASQSQTTIAASIGVDRTTVCKAISGLVRLGLTKKLYRNRQTCVYNLASIFWDKTFIRKFAKWLPALLLLLAPPFTLNKKSSIVSLNLNRSFNVLTNSTSYIQGETMERQISQQKSCETRQRTTPEVTPCKKTIYAVGELCKIVNFCEEHRAWLSCFRPEPLQASKRFLVNLLKRGERVENPFGFVYAQCMKQYHKERMEPDFRIFSTLKANAVFETFKGTKPSTYDDIIYKPELVDPPTSAVASQPRVQPSEHRYGFNHFLGVPYTKAQYEEGQRMKRMRERR